MTDELVFGEDLVQGQASGESVPQVDAAEPKPEFVTKNELREMQEALERRLQSLTDKQESRLKKEVDLELKKLEGRYAALGQQVPPEVRQRVINDKALSFTDDDPQAAQPGLSPEMAALLERTNTRGRAIVEKYGVTLDDADLAQIKRDGDPFEYLESLEAVCKAKAEQQAGGAGHAPMLVQGRPTGTRIDNINDPRELIRMGLNKQGRK